MSHDDAVKWAARRTVLWNAHDAASLTADHAIEGTVHSALAGVVRGRVGIETLYRRWFEAFPDLRFETDSPLTHLDRIALFWTIAGTHEGPFLGIAPTHRRLQFSGAFLYEIVTEEIVYERRIVDFIGVVEEAFPSR
jgi:predicted ester cyclase